MDYEKKKMKALEELKQCDRYDIEPAKTILKIFPELEESDYIIKQRLRRLLGYFKSRGIDHDLCNRILNWLEKQGEKSDYNPYKVTIESITAMVEKYANSDLKDFYDNIKVKCKNAMEYEKAYKEALSRAKKSLETAKTFDYEDEKIARDIRETVYSIFTELKDSDDEIRRELISLFQDCIDCKNHPYNASDSRRWIAWLEKHGNYNRLVEEIKERKELLSKEKEKATSTNDKLSLGGRIAMLEEILVFANEKRGEQ